MSDEKVVAKHAGKMADALVQAIRALREKVDTSVLKAAIARGDLKAALAAADVTKLWRDAYEQVMVDSLTQAAVGVLSRKHEAALSEAAPAGVEAHKRSARAKDTSFIDRWVEDHAGEEVARTSKLEAQTIKDAIRRVMADDGFDADDAAEMIKQTIGLTPQQAASLEKYREELLDEGDDDKPAYSQAEIKALLAERSDEMLAQRADTIAFNETQRAMSASQMQAWETLEEDGVIDEDWQKEWVVTSGERACDICAPMEGLQVGIKEDFSDGISMPPDPHVGCECMVILIDPADIEQNAEARARAEAHGDKPRHPFRGNQYTTGEGGDGEDDAELTDVSVSGNSRYVRANEDATAPQQLGVIARGQKLADHASMDDLPPGKATAILQHMKTKFGLTPEIIEARFEKQLELAKTTPNKYDPSVTNWEAGLPFYDEASAHVTALAKESGEPDTQVAGIYSAISPGGVWEDEKATVEFFIKAKGMKVSLSARETKAMFELVGEKGLGNLTKGRDHDEVYERGMTIDQLYDYNPTMAAYAMKAMAGRAIDRVIPVGRSYDAFADGLALALGKGSPDQILGGIKTRSFYNNIMDPANSEDVTCDSHMAKCALDNIAKDPADKMYSFVSSGKREKAGVPAKTVVFGAHPVMADIVRKLAEKHGITPPQAQAIIWTQWRNTHSRSDARAATKAMNERIANKNKVVAPNLGRSIKATKHAESTRIAVVVEREERLIPEWLDEFFMAEPEDEDAILARVAREKHGESVGHPFRGNQWTAGEGEGDSQVSFEAQPSTATALLRGLHDAPMEMKHAYLRDAVKAIDVDDIAKSVGLKGAAIERAGFYDDPKVGPVSSPSIQFLIHDDGSDDTKEKIEAFAASVGYLLRQDSVGYHRPVHEDKLPACNASEITLAEPVTPEILKSVDAAMRAHGEDSFALVSSEKGFRVLNFGSSDGTAFNRNVKAAVEAGTPDTITFEQRAFKSDGDLISNDWSKDHNGQGYISRNRAAGRPDVQRAVARANGRLEVVNRRWEALLKSYKRGEQHEAGDEDRDEVEVHGDFVGHPFRGNQWKDGFGKEDKERIPPGDPRRDENFKKWFGKSKVVDENGDPIVLYHGTHSVFDSFETDRTVDSGATSDPNAFMGAHLAQSADTASVFANGLYSGDSSGGNVVPVYVSIKNPLMVGEGRPPKDKLASLEKELESARAEFNKYSMARANDATITQAIHDAIASGDEDAISRALKDDEGSRLYDLQTAAVRRIMELKDSNRPMSESEIYDAAGMDYDKVAAALNRRTGEERMRYAERIGHKLKSALLSKGYDGVLYENAYENETGFATGLENRKTWIAFHPEQIKSAIGNRGTFSPKDKRITHGDLPGHEFRGNQWTGGRGGGVPSIKPKDAKPKDEPVAGAKLAKTSDWRVNATSAFKVSVDKPVVDESKLSGVPKPVLGNVEAIIEEPVAPPGADQNHPEQQALAYAPDVTEDKNSDGVADFAVVGVPAFSVPPPPMIARLPNLNWNERIVEAAVCERVEKDIDGAVEKYNALRTTKGENGKFRAGNDDPKYFGTDDAKHVFDVWHGSTQEARGFGVRVGGKLLGVSEEAALERDLVPELQERVFQRRAEYNTVIHQAANAVAKRAFLKELDRISTLPPDQRSVLVTAGGCAAGKGYVLEKDKQGNPRVPEVYSLVSKAAAVWDSAGDQNGTENPWVAAECAKRGIEANFVYVHTDAMNAAEKSISRALKVGRQVDGRVLGDSYEYGAKNFEAFAKQHKGGKVYYVDNNTETPFLMDELPKTRRYKSEEIRRYAEGLLTFTSEKIAKALGKVPREARDRAKARLVRALTSGRRIFAGG